MKLTEEDTRFLLGLKQDGQPTHWSRLPVATREQDIARARAKRNGWAIFDRVVWCWRITEAGRAALSQGDQS